MAAKAAGAEFVGFEDMIKKCQEGWTDFDVAVATPEAMVEVRKLIGWPNTSGWMILASVCFPKQREWAMSASCWCGPSRIAMGWTVRL
mgnify:CR=1 FL=1